MKKYRLWLGIGLLAVLLLVAGVAFTRPYSYNGSLIEPPMPAPDFSLPYAGGQTYQLSDHAGKVRLMFFGYTTCPDVCPTTLVDMKRVRAELKDKDDQMEYIFITVDPKRDTPERMQQYLAGFDPDFIGLSGDEADLSPVWKDYGVYRAEVESDSAAGYLVDHTARVYLIDPAGNLRLTYTYGTLPEDIAQDVRQVLKEAR